MRYAQDRQDFGYLPSNGEHLGPYVNRLKSVVTQTRYAYSTTHETWYTHRGTSPCWICNFMDCCDYLVGLLEDIVAEDKTHEWSCIKDPKHQDPTYFQFKPHKKS